MEHSQLIQLSVWPGPGSLYKHSPVTAAAFVPSSFTTILAFWSVLDTCTGSAPEKTRTVHSSFTHIQSASLQLCLFLTIWSIWPTSFTLFRVQSDWIWYIQIQSPVSGLKVEVGLTSHSENIVVLYFYFITAEWRKTSSREEGMLLVCSDRSYCREA